MSRAVEIGAGDRYSSQLLNTEGFDEVVLYEPNRLLYEDLFEAAQGKKGVDVFQVAVRDSGYGTLYNLGYASFLEGSPSFLSMSCEAEASQFWTPLSYKVPTVSLNWLCRKPIDYLVVTTNGSEAAILERLTVFPDTICTKHYCHNPIHWVEAHKAFNWFAANGYHGKMVDTNQHHTYLSIVWTR